MAGFLLSWLERSGFENGREVRAESAFVDLGAVSLA